ncbi:MAG: DUF507 family protein [Thermodesulfobacteriota bacterium]
MRLSEDRISHIAHLIHDGLWKDDLVDYDGDAAALKEIKRTLTEYIKAEDDVDEKVRQTIRSMSNIPEGGREWDILYRKFFEQEMKKQGF